MTKNFQTHFERKHVHRKTKCILAIKKEYFFIFIAVTVSYDAELIARSLDISEML